MVGDRIKEAKEHNRVSREGTRKTRQEKQPTLTRRRSSEVKKKRHWYRVPKKRKRLQKFIKSPAQQKTRTGN